MRRVRLRVLHPIETLIAWLLPLPAFGVASCGDPAANIRTVLALAGVWTALALRASPPRLWATLVIACLVRLPLLSLAPTLSDDLWRYVWEGRVWLHGENPLRYAPDDPLFTALRDADWARVNHREVASVYPPLAQAWFILLHRGGPLAFRAAAVLADVATVGLLFRRSPKAGWLWAALPLPALESAVSGHLESLGVLLLVAAMGGRGWAAALGALLKLLPAIMLVRMPPRRAVPLGLLTLAALGVGLAPSLRRGLGTYAAKWSYNGSIFPLLRLVAGEDGARTLCTMLAVTVVAAVVLASRNVNRITLWAMGAFVLCSPTVHPWYALWVLAAGLWCDVHAWTLLAALIPLAYIVLDGYDPATSKWEEPIWTRWVIWLPVYAALLWRGWTSITRPGPSRVD